jgi:hypothetical protein
MSRGYGRGKGPNYKGPHLVDGVMSGANPRSPTIGLDDFAMVSYWLRLMLDYWRQHPTPETDFDPEWQMDFTSDPIPNLVDHESLVHDFSAKIIAADGDSSRVAEFRPGRLGDHTYHIIQSTAHFAAIDFQHQIFVRSVDLEWPQFGNEKLDDFYERRLAFLQSNAKRFSDNFRKHIFDPAELARMEMRVARELSLLFEYIGEPLPDFATREMIAAWTYLEPRSLERYESEWKPALANPGRKGRPTLWRTDVLLPILKKRFPDGSYPK